MLIIPLIFTGLVQKYISLTILSDAHVDHVLKGLVEIVADLLDLVLLSQQVLLHLIKLSNKDSFKL